MDQNAASSSTTSLNSEINLRHHFMRLVDEEIAIVQHQLNGGNDHPSQPNLDTIRHEQNNILRQWAALPGNRQTESELLMTLYSDIGRENAQIRNRDSSSRRQQAVLIARALQLNPQNQVLVTEERNFRGRVTRTNTAMGNDNAVVSFYNNYSGRFRSTVNDAPQPTAQTSTVPHPVLRTQEEDVEREVTHLRTRISAAPTISQDDTQDQQVSDPTREFHIWNLVLRAYGRQLNLQEDQLRTLLPRIQSQDSNGAEVYAYAEAQGRMSATTNNMTAAFNRMNESLIRMEDRSSRAAKNAPTQVEAYAQLVSEIHADTMQRVERLRHDYPYVLAVLRQQFDQLHNETSGSLSQLNQHGQQLADLYPRTQRQNPTPEDIDAYNHELTRLTGTSRRIQHAIAGLDQLADYMEHPSVVSAPDTENQVRHYRDIAKRLYETERERTTQLVDTYPTLDREHRRPPAPMSSLSTSSPAEPRQLNNASRPQTQNYEQRQPTQPMPAISTSSSAGHRQLNNAPQPQEQNYLQSVLAEAWHVLYDRNESSSESWSHSEAIGQFHAQRNAVLHSGGNSTNREMFLTEQLTRLTQNEQQHGNDPARVLQYQVAQEIVLSALHNRGGNPSRHANAIRWLRERQTLMVRADMPHMEERLSSVRAYYDRQRISRNTVSSSLQGTGGMGEENRSQPVSTDMSARVQAQGSRNPRLETRTPPHDGEPLPRSKKARH